MSHTFILILLLILLIVSNTLYRLNPKLPLPFVQLLLGVLVGALFGDETVGIDAGLFLALVIAPLNFREGQESDIESLKRHKSTIAYLIFPLVFLTTLAIGGLAGYLLPVEIPLPLSFALGAALAPTDAVAFLALSKRFKFPKKLEEILTLEGLLNDASGLVAFQFAILALTTGTFSLLQASGQLGWVLLAGALVGLLFVFLHRAAVSILEKLDAADVAGVLLLEISLPLLAYLVASYLGGSGIIAVVIAGLFQSKQLKKMSLFDARVNRVTFIIWETLSFILNGFVFIVFGYEFTRIVQPALKNPFISNAWLMTTVLVLTASLFLVRFVGIFLLKLVKKSGDYQLKNLLILTFSGMKGSVSIATILLLPEVDQTTYSLILFTVGMVTLFSFLTGLLVLPLLAEPRTEATIPEGPARLAILKEVIDVLEMDVEHANNPSTIYAVIGQYYKRMENLQRQLIPVEQRREVAKLRLKILEIERAGLEKRFEEGLLDMPSYRIYQSYLSEMEQDINRDLVATWTYLFMIGRRVLAKWYHEWVELVKNKGRRMKADNQHGHPALSDLFIANTVDIIAFLNSCQSNYPKDYLTILKHYRVYQSKLVLAGVRVEDLIGRLKPDNLEDLLRGFYLERKIVAEYEADQLISNQVAKDLRRNINQLESYSLREFDSF
ncbi:cation:proton antiporter [Streptococcus sp. A22]|uniref:cation:proton antiporter n=1 Tax=Streptococcus sp. A22 TaxID=3373126 RepID=UPI00374DF43C